MPADNIANAVATDPRPSMNRRCSSRAKDFGHLRRGREQTAGWAHGIGGNGAQIHDDPRQLGPAEGLAPKSEECRDERKREIRGRPGGSDDDGLPSRLEIFVERVGDVAANVAPGRRRRPREPHRPQPELERNRHDVDDPGSGPSGCQGMPHLVNKDGDEGQQADDRPNGEAVAGPDEIAQAPPGGNVEEQEKDGGD